MKCFSSLFEASRILGSPHWHTVWPFLKKGAQQQPSGLSRLIVPTYPSIWKHHFCKDTPRSLLPDSLRAFTSELTPGRPGPEPEPPKCPTQASSTTPINTSILFATPFSRLCVVPLHGKVPASIHVVPQPQHQTTIVFTAVTVFSYYQTSTLLAALTDRLLPCTAIPPTS